MSFNKSSPNFQPSLSHVSTLTISASSCTPPGLTVTGSTILSGACYDFPTLTVTGYTIMSGTRDDNTPTLFITGSMILSGTMGSVPTFIAYGRSILSGTLTDITPTLSVTGSTILSGAIETLPTFTVTGRSILSGTAIETTPTLSVTGSTILSGAIGELLTLGIFGRTVISGTLTDITPTLSVTGSTVISGAISSIPALYVTGSTIISGNLDVQGYNVIRIGETPTGATGSYGLTTTHTGSPFVFGSYRTDGVRNESFRFSANTNKLTIDDNHILARFGWMSSGPEFTGSWVFKPYSIEADEPCSAEVLGTDADGGSSIGAVIGTSASYVTAGSKLMSVQNGGHEREAIYYDGSKTFLADDNGGYMKDNIINNVVSISGSPGTYFTADQVPAGALILGCSMRILQSLPTASVTYLGLSSSADGFQIKWGGSMSYLAGTTNSTGALGTGSVWVPADISICFSSSIVQSTASQGTGSARIVCYYRMIEPPTS